MTKTDSILIIEDDPGISRMLQVLLDSEGYAVAVARSGGVGLSLARANNPDLILLDLGLPDCNGTDLLVRGDVLAQIPVIVVTARGQEDEKVRALDAGADDYVVKPFGSAELLARIRAALRRRSRPEERPPKRYSWQGLVLDCASRMVSVDGEEVHLTPHEYDLLAVLVDNRGKALTHHAIQRQVWGCVSTGNFQTLRVTMASLRRKIKDCPSHPRFIRTEVGVGYRFLGE